MQGRIAGRTSGVKTVSPGEFSMKVKRFFANVIVLAIFAAVIFFIGWISFYVKPGKCAVMTTKTGGLYPEPIQYGKFLWRWERLLPTNVSLSQFDLKEHSYVQNVSGTLPSAEIYSAFMTPKPDFSYNITVKTVFSVSPEKIHELVKSKSIENSEESLDEYLRQKSLVAANMIAEDFIRNGKKDTLLNATVLSGRQVERILSPRLGEFDGIEIDSVEVSGNRIPDVKAYELSREAHEKYLETLNEIIREKASGQADSILQLENSMKQLEQFATLLEKYPKFNDFSKSGNLSGVMDKLIQIQ